jgi:hypothetical protein
MTRSSWVRAAMVALVCTAAAPLVQTAEAVAPTTSASEPFHQRETARGDGSFASFSVRSPLTCDDGSPGEKASFFTVSALSNVTRSDGTKVAFERVSMTTSAFDSCASTSKFFSGNDLSPTYVQRGTQSATIHATIRLTSFSTGETSLARVSLTLAASDRVVRQVFRSSIAADGGSLMQTSRGTFAEAQVTGSVTVDAGANVLEIARDVSGEIGTSTLTSLELSKPMRHTP